MTTIKSRRKLTEAELTTQAEKRAALRAQFWGAPAEAEFDRPTIGALIDVGTKAMELRASRGDTPPYVIRGKRAWYRKADVLVWMAKAGQPVRSTAERAVVANKAGSAPAAAKTKTQRIVAKWDHLKAH